MTEIKRKNVEDFVMKREDNIIYVNMIVYDEYKPVKKIRKISPIKK